MGRNWKRKNKNKHSGKPNVRKPADPSKYGEERDPYSLVATGNYKLETYYAYQGMHGEYLDSETGTFVKCDTDEQKEEERKRWLASMKSTLSASFRIGSDVDAGLRERLEKELEEYVGKKMEIEVLPKGGERRIRELDLKPEIKMVAPAKKIPFVPYAYQLSLDRQTIRRNPSLNPFHEWLKVQTEAGFVTRQETVSMIPPVVLNPERHHTVLDMCAAPGSKTSQLLEILNLPATPGASEYPKI
jgi:16S rRNA C967 or C1407 C5-methylase (RsmB/RsmF family)